MIPRWAVPLALILLGAVAGLAYTRVVTPTYTASATVVVTATAATGDRRDVSLAQALGRLVNQPEVVSAAAATVGLTPDQVIKTVQPRTSPDAPVIEIIGTAPTAMRAVAVVNAVANGLVKFTGDKMAATGVTLSVLSPASALPEPSSPKLSLDVGVGAGAGILLGALYLLATGGRSTPETPAPTALPGAVRPGPPPGFPPQPPPPGSGPRPHVPGQQPPRPGPGGPTQRPGPGGPSPKRPSPPPPPPGSPPRTPVPPRSGQPGRRPG